MSYNKIFFAFLFCLSIFSCSNELEVAAEWKNIPVVYALVDIGKDVNYFRIEKAFLDPDISGEQIAQVPDSIYYGPEVLVRLTNIRNSKSIILDRVNLEDEGLVREEGDFATSPNIGYRFRVADLDLELNESLKLEVLGPNETVWTEAVTSVVGSYIISSGQPGEVIKFLEDKDVSFGVRSSEQAARIFDCRLFINYDEQKVDQPGQIETKRLEWFVEKSKLRKKSSAGGEYQALTVFKVKGEEFYKHLANSIEEDATVMRTFKGIDLQYDAGGEELLNYINIGQANTGITSNQIIPSYTNLNNNAIGLFSSRATVVNIEDSYNINTETRDSLREGRFTAKLNFN